MPKADIATLSPILLTVGLLLPAFMSKSLSDHPMDIFMIGIPLKLLASVLGWLAIQTTHKAYQTTDEPGILFFGPLVAVLVLNEVASSLIFSSMMSFFSKVSDHAIGGTYMTLLNTVTNLGSKWPNATALYMLPKLTYAVCGPKDSTSTVPELVDAFARFDCTHSATACISHGGQCNTQLDGYTIETALCVTIGVLWIIAFRGAVKKLQHLPVKDWLVIRRD